MCKICKLFFALALSLFVASSCQGQQGSSRGEEQPSADESRERMIETNRRMLDQERGWIEEYIEEHSWVDSMQTLGNGGYIQFLQQTDDERIASKQDVHFLCTAELLDGTSIYQDENTERVWKVDRSDGELGLHHALKKMAKGEKARVILPSYQAFGLAGDLDEVPPRAPILFTIEIIDVR